MCHRELNGWFLKYKGKYFCDDENRDCIKTYLFEEADDERLIEEDKYCDDYYSMDYVRWMEDRGFG